jgi:hypothetical protein
MAPEMQIDPLEPYIEKRKRRKRSREGEGGMNIP